MEGDRPTLPGFSRKHAREWGVPEATVLRFLAYHVRRSIEKKKNFHEGKHWYYNSIRKLSEKMEWFPPSALAVILDRLREKRLIEVGCYNKWNRDKTLWYSVPPEILDAVEEDVIYFDPFVAIALGICEGVLINNLRFWMGDDECFLIEMSPTRLSRVLPFSESTIRRALARMVKAGFLWQDNATPSFYKVKHEPKYKVLPSGIIVPVNQGVSETDKWVSKTEDRVSKTDKWVSETDDITPYNPLTIPFEIPFKIPEAEPRGIISAKSTKGDWFDDED